MVISQFRNNVRLAEKLEDQYLLVKIFRLYLPISTCNKLFDTIFLPMLLYCSGVWGGGGGNDNMDMLGYCVFNETRWRSRKRGSAPPDPPPGSATVITFKYPNCSTYRSKGDKLLFLFNNIDPFILSLKLSRKRKQKLCL